jgi:16S rRNA (cytosine967-C5)-methyltransferase
VQDLAASIPARLLGQGNGRSVFDLCAAPGGKTMQLAAAGWAVTAVDTSARRLERLTDNLRRTQQTAEIVQADIRRWEPDAQADAVLLDAPCSATGIFRRHPDVLHRIEDRQIDELAALQGELLARAAGWVKPGGSLVYATCSLERAEGEEQIKAFLGTNSKWQIDPVLPDELPQGVSPDAMGCVRTLPGMLADVGGLDGFFVARLRAPST